MAKWQVVVKRQSGIIPPQSRQLIYLEPPLSMLMDRRVHGVGGKIQLAGPGHGTVIECDLREQRRVTEHCEDPSLWRMHQCGHVDHAGEAIGE